MTIHIVSFADCRTKKNVSMPSSKKAIDLLMFNRYITPTIVTHRQSTRFFLGFFFIKKNLIIGLSYWVPHLILYPCHPICIVLTVSLTKICNPSYISSISSSQPHL